MQTRSEEGQKNLKLVTNIEGNEMKMWTNLTNLETISKYLKRESSYIMRFFSIALNTKIMVDEANGYFILIGGYDESRLQHLLHGFIQLCVMCRLCYGIHSSLVVEKKKIFCDCKDCGHRRLIDSGGKILTYIVNNPPSTLSAEDGEKRNFSKTSNEPRKGEPEVVIHCRLDGVKYLVEFSSNERENFTFFLKEFLETVGCQSKSDNGANKQYENFPTIPLSKFLQMFRSVENKRKEAKVTWNGATLDEASVDIFTIGGSICGGGCAKATGQSKNSRGLRRK